MPQKRRSDSLGRGANPCMLRGLDALFGRLEMARFPFGIPNSWYLVAYSDEVDAQSLKSLPYLGRNMIVKIQ